MEISLSSVWTDLIAFAKNPRLDPLPSHFLELPKKVIPYLLAIDLLLMFPLSGIISLAGIEEMDHAVIELLNKPLLLFFMAVILAPLFEEAIFRYPIGRLFNNRFKLIFWLFTIIFAGVHLSNFGADIPYYLMPLLVLPQFILGIILGYIRVGWGFWYCVFFHALHNGILVGMATLAGAFGQT